MVKYFKFSSVEDLKSQWTDFVSRFGPHALDRCLQSLEKFPSVMEKWPVNPYFFPVDFVYSNTALKLGISNIPDSSSWFNIITLVTNYLIPLREKIKQPINISSGYRSQSLNKAVDGAANSYHMSGRACDIMCGNNRAMYNALARIAISNRKSHKPSLTELIQYSNFIHFAI